jgi:hypothetical protein
MTEDEIQAEIDLVNIAISDVLQTGRVYEVKNPASSRKFEGFSLQDLRDHRDSLYNKLDELSGNSGVIIGF